MNFDQGGRAQHRMFTRVEPADDVTGLTGHVSPTVAEIAGRDDIPFETHEELQEDRKVKLTVEVTPQLNRVIERIATATGATKSEAIRKAIVLMEVAVEARENGERLFVGTEPPPGASREIVGL